MNKENEEFINEESAQSQCSKILAYLKRGLAITAIEALKLFGCFRLAARIADLRKAGWNIITERVIRNGKYVAQYRLAL